MKKFTYLDHTADVKFRVYGIDMEECFCNLVYAVTNLMTDYTKINKKVKKKINIKAKNIKSLLYDFVNEMIYLMDVDGFVPRLLEDIEIKKDNNEIKLKGVLLGDNYKNYDMHGHIKSATYYDMEVIETKKGCEIVMVLDV